jgi:hypothetical protein
MISLIFSFYMFIDIPTSINLLLQVFLRIKQFRLLKDNMFGLMAKCLDSMHEILNSNFIKFNITKKKQLKRNSNEHILFLSIYIYENDKHILLLSNPIKTKRRSSST